MISWRLVQVALAGPDLLLECGQHVSGLTGPTGRTEVGVVGILPLLLLTLHVLPHTLLAVLLGQLLQGLRLFSEMLKINKWMMVIKQLVFGWSFNL